MARPERELLAASGARQRSSVRVVRVARFQTLFAILGLYALGFLAYVAVSSSRGALLSASAGGSHALQMFPVLGDRVPREFGGDRAVDDASASGDTAAGARSAPRLRCLGWKQTEGCDPDAPVVPAGNRSCDQFVRGAVPGYCLMEDEESGERLRVMRASCLSVRPDVVFSCRHAVEFADLRFAVDALAADLAAETTQTAGRDASVSASLSTAESEREASEASEAAPSDGIVMVVYPKLLVSALASLRVLRERLNSSLPVELWYSSVEMRTINVSAPALEALARNASTPRGLVTLRTLESADEETDGPGAGAGGGHRHLVTGFNTKVLALAHSRFDRALFLDADNVPVRDPAFLFASRELREFGAVFWPDFWHPGHTIFNIHEHSLLWELLGLDFVDMFEQESGQLLIDRRRAKASGALRMLQLLALHEPNLLARLKLAHGDKDLFRLAWLKTRSPFFMVPHPPGSAGSVRDGKFCGMSMVQADPAGDVLFLHRNAKKLTGGRGPKAAPDQQVWTHLQRFQYLGLASDARRISPATGMEEDLTLPPAPATVKDGRIRSGRLEMGYEMMKRSYHVEIYNGAPQFDGSQWCYGQMGTHAARYKTVPWEETAFADIERDLLRFAADAAAELPAKKKPVLMLAPIRIRIGG